MGPSFEQLAIVMPAYNEAACIETVVSAWLTVLERVPGTLFVVNDGSRDKTGEILDGLAANHSNLRVVHQKNAGHGAAVLRGYAEALALGAEWIFQTDSDDQFDRLDFNKLWEARNRSPFLLGQRAQRHDPLVRIIISRINAALLNVLFGVVVFDANVPFRLMKSTVLQGMLEILPPGIFAPNIFLSVIAARAGFPIVEIPVAHRERKTGTVSILRWKLWEVCLRCVRELWHFRGLLNRRRRELAALASRESEQYDRRTKESA